MSDLKDLQALFHRFNLNANKVPSKSTRSMSLVRVRLSLYNKERSWLDDEGDIMEETLHQRCGTATVEYFGVNWD